jgi:hypothetical protein
MVSHALQRVNESRINLAAKGENLSNLWPAYS